MFAADTIHTGPGTCGQILSFIKISACETDYGPVEGEIKVTQHTEVTFCVVFGEKCEFEHHGWRNDD